MRVLVVGASGATGRLLVERLLNRGHSVKAIVRATARLPEVLQNDDRLSVIRANLLELSDAGVAEHVKGCAAVACCLGHSLNLKGIYGQPRRLVSDATRRLCSAIKANAEQRPTRFVLMNTAGNSNRDLREPVSFGERCIMALFRLLLPPHVDNETAADYLRVEIGRKDRSIEWTVVRPDTLRNEGDVTEYEVHPSPTTSAIFNAGETSRINVAHFMADLAAGGDVWEKWKGRMPVIYNKRSQ